MLGTEFIKGNQQWIAVTADNPTIGEMTLLLRNNPQNLPKNYPKLICHEEQLQYFQFLPYHSNYLATASAEIRIWRLPDKVEDLTTLKPLLELKGHTKKINLLSFNQSTAGLLASASYDSTLRVWDITRASTSNELFQYSPNKTPSSLQWDCNGKLIGSTWKDGYIRLWDPRQNKIANQFFAYQQTKASQLSFMGSLPNFVTLGFNNSNQRQLCLWDTRNLQNYAQQLTFDETTGQMSFHYDQDLQILYLSEHGDPQIKCYQYNQNFVQMSNSQNLSRGFMSYSFLPKYVLDTTTNEIAKILRIMSDKRIEIISVTPKKLMTGISQDKIYPPTARRFSLNLQQWLDGDSNEPVKVSLQENNNLNEIAGDLEIPNKIYSVKIEQTQQAITSPVQTVQNLQDSQLQAQSSQYTRSNQGSQQQDQSSLQQKPQQIALTQAQESHAIQLYNIVTTVPSPNQQIQKPVNNQDNSEILLQKRIDSINQSQDQQPIHLFTTNNPQIITTQPTSVNYNTQPDKNTTIHKGKMSQPSEMLINQQNLAVQAEQKTGISKGIDQENLIRQIKVLQQKLNLQEIDNQIRKEYREREETYKELVDTYEKLVREQKLLLSLFEQQQERSADHSESKKQSDESQNQIPSDEQNYGSQDKETSNMQKILQDIFVKFNKYVQHLTIPIHQETILNDIQLRFIFSLSYLLNFSRLLIDKYALYLCGNYNSLYNKIDSYFFNRFIDQITELNQLDMSQQHLVRITQNHQLLDIQEKSFGVIQFFDRCVKNSGLLQFYINGHIDNESEKIIRYVFFHDSEQKFKIVGMAGLYNVMFLNYKVYLDINQQDHEYVYEICLLRLLVHEYAHLYLRYDNFLENSDYQDTQFQEGGYRLEEKVFGTNSDIFWRPIKDDKIELDVLREIHAAIFDEQNWKANSIELIPDTIAKVILKHKNANMFGRELRNTQFSGMCEEIKPKKVQLFAM